MHNRAAISDLLQRGGLSPRRDLGQNFVADANTVRRIARLAEVGPGDHVVEIGAGLGSLTLALAETGAQVLAMEVDRGVVPVLRELTASLPNVTVVEADAMKTDWPALLAAHVGDSNDNGVNDVHSVNDHGWVMVANLPYNVATPLVCDLLDDVPQIQRMLVMVQREAAERFCAVPRTPQYGAVTVKIGYWATARIVGHVPASVFVPRPNVESSLADIRRRDQPATEAPSTELFTLVRTAFGQRRKMLRRSLAAVVEPAVFEAAGIDSQRRPEELDVGEWGQLTRAWMAAG